MKGFDQVCNLVLLFPSKLIYSKENGVIQKKYYSINNQDKNKESNKGETNQKEKNYIHVIRGSDVCCIGLIERKHALQLEEHLEAVYYFQKQDLSGIKVNGPIPFSNS